MANQGQWNAKLGGLKVKSGGHGSSANGMPDIPVLEKCYSYMCAHISIKVTEISKQIVPKKFEKNWTLTPGQIDVRTSVLLVDGCRSLSIVQNILDSTKKIIEYFH